MTNLTEYSWYYCKMNDGDIRMLERGADYFLDGDVPLLNNEVKSVLTEVPSYEELQNQAFILKSRESEIVKLKELLKEWLLFEKEENPHDFTIMSERMEELAKQSKELLGEDR